MKKVLLSAILLASAAATQAQNVYTYYFNGDFHEAGGVGPDLTPICTGSFVQDTLTDFGSLYRQVYHFDQNCGFEFDDSLGGFIASGTYSIELYFKMNSLSSWKRVIDFKMRTTDYGCYVFNGQLNFYNIATSNNGAPFAANEYSHYVITRDDATKNVLMYGDGDKYITFNDAAGNAVYSANKKLRFFQDDLVVANEASSGSIGILKIYNYALDSTTVSDIYDDLNSTLGLNKVKQNDLKVGMYPNPVSDALSISLPTEGKYTYSISSFTGSVVKTGNVSNTAKTIDVANMAPGMYVLKVTGENGISGNMKFVKQ